MSLQGFLTGVGLYINESFPSRRSDLEILPEDIVSEFHINKGNIFPLFSIEVAVKIKHSSKTSLKILRV